MATSRPFPHRSAVCVNDRPGRPTIPRPHLRQVEEWTPHRLVKILKELIEIADGRKGDLDEAEMINAARRQGFYGSRASLPASCWS